jgi:hemoglobin
MRTLSRITVALVLLSFLTVGCKSGSRSGETPASGSAATAEPSLYTKLGGESALKAVVDQFVANVAADSRINKFFATTDLDHLKAQIVNQIGQATGGPQKYTGRDMKTTHAGMGIAEADFNALVEDLVKALDQFKVGETEKSQLLAILGPMKSDIVEK